MDHQTLANSILSEVLNFANVGLTVTILFLLVVQWRKGGTTHLSAVANAHSPALIAISAYWALCYIYITLDQPWHLEICAWLGDCSNNWFGSVFIKPALTFTFAIMLSMMIHPNIRKSRRKNHDSG